MHGLDTVQQEYSMKTCCIWYSLMVLALMKTSAIVAVF